jgi:hypothetical protein
MVIHLAGIYIFPTIVFLPVLLSFSTEEDAMKQSDEFLENAGNCAQLAEHAPDEPTHNRYKRMEAAWRALAQEQDWLDGEVPPQRKADGQDARKTPPA